MQNSADGATFVVISQLPYQTFLILCGLHTKAILSHTKCIFSINIKAMNIIIML